MPKLIVMCAPPGAGKSTYALSLSQFAYVNQDTQGKDHLRIFQEHIKNNLDICVDRMGFNKQQRDRYLLPAKEAGYETEIVVLHEPYSVCLERCLSRVGHPTIQDEKSARYALQTFFTKYERPTEDEANKVTFIYPDGQKPSAIICDLDGTLCNVDHRLHTVRPPKDWEEEILLAKKEKRKNIYGWKPDWKSFFYNIPGDSLNNWCEDLITRFSLTHKIVFCSGRPDDYKKVTKDWLKYNNIWYDDLFMRPRNDSRDDSTVKEIILDFEILTRYTPYFMIDDRKRVFEMWRSRGFTCLACANGDF